MTLGVAFLTALVAPGCSDTTGPGVELKTQLAARRAQWQAVRPGRYTVEIVRRCFCPFVGWVRIEVEGETVLNAVAVEEPEWPLHPGALQVPQIDELFQILEDAIEERAYRIDVEWSDEWGYPEEFFIDYQEDVADEEIGYGVRAFAPASP